ncbi:hypothetical protein LDJ78_24045 [Citrobacter portucalensis]|uniref:phage baseplate plug family protein n=1 Tax=Citrobacter portucalensis TaxID=1639133 RepID=UPI001C640C09|nr:hypothetical protein [Citrobacter portucalensis]MBW7622363.1 hypothetical protein [Citrobacter portucalensis]MBW7641315.1 hypothetical protein [Citrobacter portucalensis]MCA2135801.1 hypothetical protein [Citrobacter portucalensis]MCA2146004.1 hypothetical protein [Citrobacter portucalensis]MCA2150799.1 hypothetical protein [Citrobacter portucalensis]
MKINEIPLSADNQTFRVMLGDINYTLKVVWRDEAGWIMDVMDSGAQPLLMGVPLVPDVDLIEQYPELGISGALIVITDNGAPEYPTKTNLGSSSHLYFAQVTA